MSDANIELLAPIIARVRTDTCCVKKPGTPPARINQALTPAKLAKHLNGGPVYGAYVMQPRASTTRIALFDFDNHKGASTWAEMQAAALRVLVAAHDAGLRANAFRSSGGSGVHLIFMWEDDQDAYSVRAAMRAVLESTGFKEGNIGGIAAGNVEIFPKQDVATDFGHMFVLPLGGKSVPLDTFELDDMPRYGAIDWQMSEPVEVAARPERAPVVSVAPADLAELASAVAAIPQGTDDEPDRDGYLKVVFGIHHASQGSEGGYALALGFASRSPTFEQTRFDSDWNSARTARDGATATFQTIKNIAREYGWEEPIGDDFEIIALAPDEQEAPPLPKFQRDRKGDILATVENVHLALLDPWVTGVEIAYDRFRDELMLTQRGAVEWRAFTDPDYMRLRIKLEKGGFKPIGREMIRDAVALIGDENRFDSAVLWLSRLEWDGQPRCAAFLQSYFGVAVSPYAKAVSLYLWSALAGRVMSPGVKADMVPVLVGPQGLGKSEGIAAMVPSEDHFVEVALDAHDDSMARKMRGVLIGEIAELRGLQTREIEAVKAFITRRHEKWVPKFKEFAITYPRRLLFMGTSNPEEILADETGNRRWLPVKVSTVDREAIARDRLQLWAESRELFGANGVMWRDAQALAEPEHAAFMVNDAWAQSIEGWLDESEFGEENLRRTTPIRIHDVLVGALRFNARDILQIHEKRVGRILTAMGFQRVTRRVTGKLAKVWVDPRHEGGEDLV